MTLPLRTYRLIHKATGQPVLTTDVTSESQAGAMYYIRRMLQVRRLPASMRVVDVTPKKASKAL